jgi:mannosyltransferase OCH1-like enzyme
LLVHTTHRLQAAAGGWTTDETWTFAHTMWSLHDINHLIWFDFWNKLYVYLFIYLFIYLNI